LGALLAVAKGIDDVSKMKVPKEIGRRLLQCFDSLGQEDKDQMTPPKCNDCGSEMEVGFMVGPEAMGLDWHSGVPKPETLFGLKTQQYKINRKQMLTTITYRCTKCGLLKSYAHEKDS